eukprot:6888436-Karenia_brevis.AAC.1
MIRRTHDPVYIGNHPEPTTEGDWGHFEVGGERLHCHEAQRYYKGKRVFFAWEKLDDIVQGPQTGPNVTPQEKFEYRPIDYDVIGYNLDLIREW